MAFSWTCCRRRSNYSRTSCWICFSSTNYRPAGDRGKTRYIVRLRINDVVEQLWNVEATKPFLRARARMCHRLIPISGLHSSLSADIYPNTLTFLLSKPIHIFIPDLTFNICSSLKKWKQSISSSEDREFALLFATLKTFEITFCLALLASTMWSI